MVEEKKKRPKIGLSLFSNLTSNKKKSPTTRTFENCEAVGLGILLVSSSLTHHHHHHHRNNTTINSNNNNKTSPIPIVSLSKAVANFNNKRDPSSDYDEGYTCVISHVDGRIKRHVYFYGDEVKPNGILHVSTSPMVLVSSRGGTSKMEFGFSEERREFWGKDLLSACYLCRKLLHGLDIFMYRGEKAFCSVECREKQIVSEDYRDKCSSEASPCSSLQVFFSGVAAA